MVRSVVDSLSLLGLDLAATRLIVLCDGYRTRNEFRDDNPWYAHPALSAIVLQVDLRRVGAWRSWGSSRRVTSPRTPNMSDD